ncbi:transcriptional regulator [Amycolatopsis saalfeldensis]|uniref:DNA-binding transcriptional regulator, XRE-family HTH domain n=1 Tax=Amycolatopsis saalfeldensis TaxID=394193 RepID=A0A1H8QRK3_9PSEU|nr:helix-turn-helix transcriptional regulator [Amycolatopsis saalfeldensis]SEO56825.1 DNA-binding transcriptional regulator, XRE-family HTH domain [Amycolatopsis saalfeldensis]
MSDKDSPRCVAELAGAELGVFLRGRRDALRLTVPTVADRARMGATTLRKLENGETQLTSLAVVSGLARALCMSPYELVVKTVRGQDVDPMKEGGPKAQGSLGDRIGLARSVTGWHVEEAARRVGVGIGTLRGLEAGKYLPSVPLLLKIAHGLQTSMTRLLVLAMRDFEAWEQREREQGKVWRPPGTVSKSPGSLTVPAWARQIREVRKGHGRSQEETARQAGISSGYLCSLELGRSDPVGDVVRLVVGLADALGLPREELWMTALRGHESELPGAMQPATVDGGS